MMANEAVLVVDDEHVLRRNLVRYLRSVGYDAEGAPDVATARRHLEEKECAVVLTDLRMPNEGGQAVLSHIAAHYPQTMSMVMTAFGTLETAVEALRVGAHDYILKPVVLEDVAARIANLLRRREVELQAARLRREVNRPPPSKIVGSSPAMASIHRLLAKVAPSKANVLILGETGTGKELLAHAVHEMSPLADNEFIAVNLAAMPKDLIEAALFGHERGAFTGAAKHREGVFRAANGGTVFLDEIGELPLPQQATLLRVLENREVTPIGADRPQPVSFRLVAATNQSLKERAESGAFRMDLYYRLAVFTIEAPSLRERPEDIPELASHFVERHATSLGRHLLGLDARALRALRAYPWPGNVRELSNVIERAVLLADGPWITAEDLPGEITAAAPSEVLPLREALDQFRLRHIRAVLDSVNGDKEEAARLLQVHLATLYRNLGE